MTTVPTLNSDERPRHPKTKGAPSEPHAIFGLLVDAVEDYAIFALDPQGHILTWNAGGERLKGYRADEVIGKHFSIFYMPPDIARSHPQHELEIATEKGKYEEEGWRVKKDGSTFWANVVITALRDPSGVLRGFGKVTRDLTERKNAETRLRQSEECLRASHSELEMRVQQRTAELEEAKTKAERAVAARDQFFSMASHELKTPLSSLKLQAQLRRRSVVAGDFSDFAPENLKELCDNDERQINRLTYLVDNMLDISKLTAGALELNLEDVNLSTLLTDVIQVLGPTLENSKNTLAMNCPKTLRGEWDRTRIEQVFTNLLSNCAKYAPRTAIEIHAVAKGGLVSVLVKDFGPGIPREKLRKIFHPFERLNINEATGLGLGLYITRQIVEAHGGTIIVDSTPGKGSTFAVCLPISPPEGACP